MSELSMSEILPGLYRAVLDAVASLESRHRRREAAEIRTEAIRVYSGAWTADAAGRLRALRARAGRYTDPSQRTRRETVVEAIGRAADMERRPA